MHNNQYLPSDYKNRTPESWWWVVMVLLLNTGIFMNILGFIPKKENPTAKMRNAAKSLSKKNKHLSIENLLPQCKSKPQK